MEEVIKEKQFRPKAHILTLLGEELIKNPVMAIYELVKNSYDADAKKVDVIFRDIEDIDKAAIVIEDNGIGMTEDIVENVWLEPGTDFRKPINSETGFRQIIKSPIFGRVPMGEKGVGRFAVHKLASKILLITRPVLFVRNIETGEILESHIADYEIQLFINWKDFIQSKYLSDVPIKWKVKTDQNSFRFKESSGTYIHLSGLKETWTKGMARQLKGQILTMLSPKIDDNAFKINLSFDNKWLVDYPNVKEVIEGAPYFITAYVDSDFNLDFEYYFMLAVNKKIGDRQIKNNPKYNRNIKGDIRNRYEKYLLSKEYEKEKIAELLTEFDKDSFTFSFGGLMFEFYSFDLDSPSMRDYTYDEKPTRDILKAFSGIKVFKNDMRVYDYGEPGNDWLNLDLKRVNNKEWFSNNQNIGYVYLDSESSIRLIEKTNREGFINNETFQLFVLVLDYILTEFRATRSSDRARWLRYNQKASNDLFENKILNFRTIINKVDFDSEVKRKLLLDEANRLEEKYEEDKKTLLIPAGVGMTASIALHEIEKLVPRMEETVKSIPLKQDVITGQVFELKEYVAGIISVLRKGGNKPVDLKESAEKAFSNYKIKLINRKISYKIDIDEDVTSIRCDKRFLITMLMNVIDNSIYWLDTIYKADKAIYLKAFKKNSFVHIVIADNGPGFKDDISDLIRPFFSRKEDGIGIGLYLIDTIMLQYGKFNIINETDEIERIGIPDIYNGAIVELVFNKNQ